MMTNEVPTQETKSLQRFGLKKELDYFVENLSMLIASGMPILDVLDSIASGVKTRQMKDILSSMRTELESGSPLWETITKTNLFSGHAVALIKIGEETGKLTENLKVVALDIEKSRIFKAKLRSAMMYPLFVLGLMLFIGIGIAWFILPKLALVFSQLKIDLPLVTKILIDIGSFLNTYGIFVVPLLIITIVAILYILFAYRKTKYLGQYILFSLPIIKTLIKQVEISRLGHLLGTLLEAGLPITNAFDSLAKTTESPHYQKLYLYLRDSVRDGNSIQKSFSGFKKINSLIPFPIQQLIGTGEKSGTLATILLKIGQTFESKSDTTTKNLTTILEPVLLVVVWLGVVGVALAVILPIYSLVGGFKAN